MDQSRKVAEPARGQLNMETKCPCRCIRGKYILCTAVCIYLHSRYFFLFGYMYVRSRFTAVYTMHICVTTAVPVHIMCYEYSSTYVSSTYYVP